MPKVISLAAAAEKENAASSRRPQSSKYGKEDEVGQRKRAGADRKPLAHHHGPTSSSADSAYSRGVLKSSSSSSGRGNNRREYGGGLDEEDDDEEKAREQDVMYDDEFVNPVVSRAPPMMPMSSPPGMAMPRRRDEAEYESAPSRREKLLEEKLRLLTAERDAVQAQFDELRELRLTEPERIMAELKRVAEQQAKASFDSFRSLSAQLEASEARVRELEQQQQGASGGMRGGKCDECEAKADVVEGLRAKLREATDRVERRQGDVARLEAELASRARPAPASGTAADQRAVRKLYEDLTGIVINRVEPVEQDDLLRFSMVFACDGYHDLEFSLQESKSNLPPSSSSSSSSSSSRPPPPGARRDDLVYCPHLDADRDSELLRSKLFPQHLRDDLRFDRALSVKFLSTMQGKLKRG